jgi:glycosyltransferase involved in cell wall biosynthesis
VYLALSRFEAVPLSLLEAMASGCVVAGFTGWGGELFANRSNGFWVAEDDTLSAASALSQALRLVLRGGEDHADLVRTAVLDARRYNLGQFKKSVVQLWQSVLKALTDGSQ